MIASTKFISFLVAACLAMATLTSAFAPAAIQQPTATTFAAPTTTTSRSVLGMAPKYDGDQWVPTTPEEGTDAYPAIKTLLLHGPIPFYNRIFKNKDYQQAVLKFMATDKVDRLEAQGNMDFYLSWVGTFFLSIYLFFF